MKEMIIKKAKNCNINPLLLLYHASMDYLYVYYYYSSLLINFQLHQVFTFPIETVNSQNYWQTVWLEMVLLSW